MNTNFEMGGATKAADDAENEKEKLCPDCMCYYTTETHDCPPWLKALVKRKSTSPLPKEKPSWSEEFDKKFKNNLWSDADSLAISMEYQVKQFITQVYKEAYNEGLNEFKIHEDIQGSLRKVLEQAKEEERERCIKLIEEKKIGQNVVFNMIARGKLDEAKEANCYNHCLNQVKKIIKGKR